MLFRRRRQTLRDAPSPDWAPTVLARRRDRCCYGSPTEQERQQITQLVRATNGRRRTRLLDPDDVIRLVQRIQSAPDGSYDYESGGRVTATSYGYPAWTSMAFAARASDRVWYDVITCPAYKATPGRCWYALQYYERGDMRRKVADWVAWVRRVANTQSIAACRVPCPCTDEELVAVDYLLENEPDPQRQAKLKKICK